MRGWHSWRCASYQRVPARHLRSLPASLISSLPTWPIPLRGFQISRYFPALFDFTSWCFFREDDFAAHLKQEDFVYISRCQGQAERWVLRRTNYFTAITDETCLDLS